MFVWIFHRVSGILLVALLSAQLASGFFQASPASPEDVRAVAAAAHRHAALNCVLAFCVIFHGLYGLRTVALDCGLKRERLLFWVCTALGLALFVAFLVAYFAYVAA